MDLRFVSALAVAKGLKFLIKKTGGGGTAAPGLVSLYLDPKLLKKLSENLQKTILVTGTNGKTTTTRIVSSIFEKEAVSFSHNREGSNLERGLVSALIENSLPSGTLKVATGLFEVDEAALSKVISSTKPTELVITNLFRDQLDRYGEIDNIKKIWEKAIGSLDKETTLVLNADDPTTAYLGAKTKSKVIYFGINDQSVKLTEPPTALDSIKCPQCNSDLTYNLYYVSHQGDYFCKNCQFKRPDLAVTAERISVSENGSEFILKDEKDKVQFNLETSLPGLYNVYNILASYCLLKAYGISLDNFPVCLKNFQAVFGRSEKLEMDERKIVVALAKNPTGFNEIIRTFLNKEEGTVLIAINDLIADGRDVSWLWDVDFESLQKKNLKFFTSGLRRFDMVLRLKYAGIKNYQSEKNLEEALSLALSSIPANDTLLIIPTYTAMLELKKILAKQKVSSQFWED
jgi:UDP-N-acetylmuramyl tripeptide synthase